MSHSEIKGKVNLRKADIAMNNLYEKVKEQ